MSYPSIEKAKEILQVRKQVRSGNWIRHSENVAWAAEKIAQQIGMNQELAYCMGLLHDIGRSFTGGQFLHIVKGYEYMNQLGYDEIARICLTHSFAIQDVYSYVGKMDISPSDVVKYQKLLGQIKYNDYDRLIQFCDCISTESGFVLPKQKFTQQTFQYGMNSFTMEKRKAVLAIGEHFERKIGRNVNEFLKGKLE